MSTHGAFNSLKHRNECLKFLTDQKDKFVVLLQKSKSFKIHLEKCKLDKSNNNKKVNKG